jgi:hypothetical protein
VNDLEDVEAAGFPVTVMLVLISENLVSYLWKIGISLERSFPFSRSVGKEMLSWKIVARRQSLTSFEVISKLADVLGQNVSANVGWLRRKSCL